MRRALLKRIAPLICMALVFAAGGRVRGAAADVTRLTVYFTLSAENQFYLVPVGVDVPRTDRPAEKALETLIKGAPAGSLAISLIPAETRLLGYRVEDGTAFVDFSDEITRANVGSSGEALMVDSITATLGQFPEVSRVQILVEGKPAETLAGHVDIAGPLPVRDIRGSSLFRGFEDTSGHWAEGGITTIYAAGIISGFPDGLFHPQNPVTRAEFVKMLVVSMKAPAPGGPGESRGAFEDVPDTAWYKTYLDRAVAAGIVVPSDYGDRFRADTRISRREVAVMLVRARGLDGEAVEKRGAPLPFTDTATQPDWAKGYLAVALERGLMIGNPDGTFRPYGNLTRAEAATVICRGVAIGGPNLFLIRPTEGEVVSESVLVAGVARVFEGAVCARVKRGGDVISQVCTTTTEGAPGWGFFAAMLDVPRDGHGDLTIEALTFSAKDGSEQDVAGSSVVTRGTR